VARSPVAAGRGWTGSLWARSGAVSRAWLCHLDPRAPKPPRFLHGLAGKVGGQDPGLCVPAWCRHGAGWDGPVSPSRSRWAPGREAEAHLILPSAGSPALMFSLRCLAASPAPAAWLATGGCWVLACTPERAAAGRRNGRRCGRGCRLRWFGVTASYCPGAQLLNCWCWPVPGGLPIPAIQNPCQDPEKPDPHSGGLCSRAW